MRIRYRSAARRPVARRLLVPISTLDWAVSRTSVLFAAAIVLLGLLAHANSVPSPFVFDDAAAVRENHPRATRRCRVNRLSTYHATNVATHVACALLLLYDGVFRFRSWREAVRSRGTLYASLAATWIVLMALVQSGPRESSIGFA